MLPGMELMSCPELAVPRDVMHHIVRVESSFNPYAIGVVGGHLVRQPKTLDEALATVGMLERGGYNFSIGLAQVNRYNLAKYGLTSYEQAFGPCANLKAGSQILAECYRRHQDWGKSFSCYYSGNAFTGFRHGYVQKVFDSIAQAQAGRPVQGAGGIPVVARPSRKPVAVQHFPLRGGAGPLEAPGRIMPATQDVSSSDPASIHYRSESARPAGAIPASASVDPPVQAAVPHALPGTADGGPMVVNPMPLSGGAVRLEPQHPPPSTTAPPLRPAAPPAGDSAFVF